MIHHTPHHHLHHHPHHHPYPYHQPQQGGYAHGTMPMPAVGNPHQFANLPSTMAVELVTVPEAPPGCPRGMEWLANTSIIIVKQRVELFEVFTGFDTNNRYDIFNEFNQRIYYAGEMSDYFSRCCLGSRRPFEIVIMDNAGSILLNIQRAISFCSILLCGSCCNSLDIVTADGQYIGKMVENICDCAPSYIIYDETGASVLKIFGPTCCCRSGHVQFPVSNLNGEQIGTIQKFWGGFLKEMVTTADTFGVTFPVEMDVKLKCLLLGAVFMIDFMFFEDKPSRHRHRHDDYW